jgi:endo-1,4-beta-xylanase
VTVQGSDQYPLIVEVIGPHGRRYFRSWTSSSARSSWTPQGADESKPFTRDGNVTLSGTSLTQGISRGETIRGGTADQALTHQPLARPGPGNRPQAAAWWFGRLTQPNSTC